MAGAQRTGSFRDRHNEYMKDPEYAAQFDAEIERIRVFDAAVNAHRDATPTLRPQGRTALRVALVGFLLAAIGFAWMWAVYGDGFLLFMASASIVGGLATVRDLWRLR